MSTHRLDQTRPLLETRSSRTGSCGPRVPISILESGVRNGLPPISDDHLELLALNRLPERASEPPGARPEPDRLACAPPARSPLASVPLQSKRAGRTQSW